MYHSLVTPVLENGVIMNFAKIIVTELFKCDISTLGFIHQNRYYHL